jgi:rubrerythrin
MTKQELLDLLTEGLRTEEHATAVYLKHMNAIAQRSDLDDETIAKLRTMLTSLTKENERHATMLQNLKDTAEESDSNDF